MDLVTGFSIFAIHGGGGQRAVGMVVGDVGLFDYFLMGL